MSSIECPIKNSDIKSGKGVLMIGSERDEASRLLRE